MSYIVNFTDKDNKRPITVFDNTSNTETSLVIPGRNVAGYGQIIAENFIHLLENFASANPPKNPIEGQLWYDADSGILQLYDSTGWKSASNIQRGPVEPAIEESKVGELWVDTTNQQLRIYTGSRWILVGPTESFKDGQRFGPAIEQIDDTDGFARTILSFYISGIPVIIFSKDSFVPKSTILGYPSIRSGININAPQSAEIENFVGGFLPKLLGVSTASDALVVGDIQVPANRFLRSDLVNTTDFRFNIRNNDGISIGAEGTFRLSTTPTSARIYNASAGSSLDLQINRNGLPNTTLRIIENNVGINKLNPLQALDVDGSIAATGSIIVTNTSESTNLNNGSIRTAGGIAITKNVIVGTTLTVNGTTRVSTIEPLTTDNIDNGTPSRRWNSVRAKTIIADVIQGTLAGNIDGKAKTADSLTGVTRFRIDGDIISQEILFDGRAGEPPKVFQTELTGNIIANKPLPFPNVSRKSDFVLTFRAQEPGQQSGLFRQSRETFIGDLGVPIGTILPFAGSVAPRGYLFCDGSEVDRQQYPDLFSVVGNNYTGPTPLRGINTFRLPDLRGRFGLGRDNMSNNLPSIATDSGSFVSPGGGNIDRVPDVNADILGGSGGQFNVSLNINNLPEHSHTLRNGNVQYSVVRVDPSINPPATTGLGPTATAQAQYLNDSGGIRAPAGTTFGNPIGLMNPFLTINYIIRSGPPEFT